ncbi:MAG: hypothetical protein AAF570_15825, partial [Bacteroidota bacterium]
FSEENADRSKLGLSLSLYKDHLTFSYTKYLYRHHDLALQLAGMRDRTEVLCQKIRSNTDGARDQFIADARG